MGGCSVKEIAALLPLPTSSFHILLALADGEKHGYAITKDVTSSTNGHVPLGSGTLYRQLKQLLTDGWITETQRSDDDSAGRRYYRLTALGRRVAQAEAARLAELVELARSRKLLAIPA